MTKQTLLLLYGGRSAERDVSVLSAQSVMRAVNYDKFHVKTYFISQKGAFFKTQEFTSQPGEDDLLMTNATINGAHPIKPSDIYEPNAVVFPVLHGPMGEDGSMQGFLEVLGLPYVGTNVLASSVAMDKITTKHILETVGVPQVAYTVYIEGGDLEACLLDSMEKLVFPVFVKPANMGSSVGISKANNEEELRLAIKEALAFDSRILIEQGVVAREIEVGILGNTDIRTTEPGEVIKDVDFYDYKAKYIDNNIKMAIPAEIPVAVMEQMRDYAARAFRALSGSGLSRCDFFYTESGEIFLNELNTMPGFTQWSMYPLLWENMGLAYPDLIEELVRLAQDMYAKRERHLQ